MKRDRFVRIDGATKGVDWDLVERARSLTGLKGYVTNIPIRDMDGAAVVAAYQELYQVERSFRMAKSDLSCDVGSDLVGLTGADLRFRVPGCD